MKVQVKCPHNKDQGVTWFKLCGWTGEIMLANGEHENWVRYCPWCGGRLTKEDVR